MTSSSVTDFLISFSFIAAGSYALLTRLRVSDAPSVRDQHEAIPRGNRRRGDGPRSVGPR